MDRDSFTIDLVSNGSMNFYPDNTISAFQNRIDPPLELNGDWEAALTEVYFPLKFAGEAEIKYSLKVKYFNAYNTHSTNFVITNDWVYESPIKTVPFFLNDSSEKILKSLQQSFDETMKELPSQYIKEITPADYPLKIGTDKLQIGVHYFDKDSMGISPFYKDGAPELESSVFEKKGKKEFSMKTYLQKMNGEMIRSDIHGCIYVPIFNMKVKKTLGIDKLSDDWWSYVNKERLFSSSPVFNLEAAKDKIFLMYLYTDIIRDHMIGGTQAPVLRAVPLTSGIYKDIGYCTFNHRIYYPIRKNHIESISVLATHDSGDQVAFEGNGRMFLSLDFRKKVV